MTVQIKLQVLGENGQKTPFTINTEKENFINSIIEIGKNNEISEADKAKLIELAKRNGDKNTIEDCDMTLDDKINYANFCGYNNFYDIKISKDQKYLEVKIKETGALCPNPTLGEIKQDFLGGKDNILVQKGEIPHGNSGVIDDKKYRENYDSYDEYPIEEGKTIRIPIEELQFNEKPRNWWARLTH